MAHAYKGWFKGSRNLKTFIEHVLFELNFSKLKKMLLQVKAKRPALSGSRGLNVTGLYLSDYWRGRKMAF